MSYIVLARKYRPQKFKDFAGQKHILNSLIHGLDYNRLHHSYLLTGTRGVGKTSLARLLAKSLNCLTGISSNPCGKCQHCAAIKNGVFVDLIEIDAASRTRVEDTREILENVQYMPSQGRFKIYLIDEVHMLSNHSFNALLKIIEEPPQHVKFILATTDPEKLPATIISRCLQFHLKHLTAKEICAHLAHVLTAEKVTYQTEALKHIAQAAKGSLRDALSLTDQAISFSNGKILKNATQEMLGVVEVKVVDELLKHVIQSDSEKIISLSNKINAAPKDPIIILDTLAQSFYAASIYKLTQTVPDISCSKSMVVTISEQLSLKLLQTYYQLIVKTKSYVPLAPSPESGLGMALLRLSTLQKTNLPRNKHDENNEALNTVLENTAKQINWHQISPGLNLKGTTMQVALHSNLEGANNNLYRLKPSERIEIFINKNTHREIEIALSQYLGKAIKVEFIKDKTIKSAEIGRKDSKNIIEITSPVKTYTDKRASKIKNITTLLSKNPDIEKLKKLGFTLDLSSVRLK